MRGCKPPHAQPPVVIEPGALAGLFFVSSSPDRESLPINVIGDRRERDKEAAGPLGGAIRKGVSKPPARHAARFAKKGFVLLQSRSVEGVADVIDRVVDLLASLFHWAFVAAREHRAHGEDPSEHYYFGESFELIHHYELSL
jgi:hypothetical protein